MGSFHGRRKPSAKKASKPKGDTAEEIAARQARDQFIKDMAAKALPPPADVDTGGIHPSRLARTGPIAGARPDSGFSGHQYDGPSRGQRAPDLRKQGNKRTFEDTEPSNLGSSGPNKKQRTLEEIRRLKGPAAMKKEEEKRRQQARKAEEEAEARKAAQLKKESGPRSDDEETPIPSKSGKKDITNGSSTSKTPEEKAQRKAEKAARKAAKKSVTDVAEVQNDDSVASEPVSESKEARKERRKAEKAMKANEGTLTASSDVITEEKETKEQKKERKRLAKLAASTSIEQDATSEKDAKKASKKEKKAKSSKLTDESSVAKPSNYTPPPPSTTDWASAASSLGSKSSKFLKLMGGAKAGQVLAPSTSNDKPDNKSRDARKAEKEIERQYAAGMQAKQSGSRRGGLGA